MNVEICLYINMYTLLTSHCLFIDNHLDLICIILSDCDVMIYHANTKSRNIVPMIYLELF